MKFKVGDKVKFLNESGGGIVSKIISNLMVNVAVEEGFDIPYLNGDLVLLEATTNHSEKMFNEDFNVELKSDVKIESAQAPIPSFSNAKNIKQAKEASGVYLAFVPHDQKWFITGMLDVYLVNHTSSDILFSLFLKNENSFSGYDYSSIEPESAHLLDSIEREQAEDWREGIVQILYHQDEVNEVLLPAHTNFKIKQSKLNNENAYQFNGFIEGKAFVVSLNEIQHQQKANSIFGKDEVVEEQKSVEKKEEAIIDKHQTLPKIAEVDLHIGELMDNISGMESRDMFAFQKKYFKDCLESAILNNYKKVTFIHGVGNGRLKNAIVEILKQYEDLENQSASIAKYGVGAIDVLIKPWK